MVSSLTKANDINKKFIFSPRWTTWAINTHTQTEF